MSKSVTKEETKPVKSKSVSTQIDKILETPEGQEYLKMCEITGSMQKHELYEDPIKATDFSAAYYRWLEAEKPKLKMPPMPNQSKIKIPRTFSRLIYKGDEYVVIENSDGTKEGVKYKPKYAEETHPNTLLPMDIGVVIGHSAEYFLKFDPEELKARMAHAKNLLEVGQDYKCYIYTNDRNYICSPENFLRPWKDLMQDIAQRKPIHV